MFARICSKVNQELEDLEFQPENDQNISKQIITPHVNQFHSHTLQAVSILFLIMRANRNRGFSNVVLNHAISRKNQI